MTGATEAPRSLVASDLSDASDPSDRSDASNAPSNWTQRFELQGAERRIALAQAQAVIAGWGLTMPSADPLVLHFGLGEFAQIGEIEYWIVNDTDNRYCGKFLFLFEGQRCPNHYHATKDETFFIVRGTVGMCVDGEERALRAGDVLKMPPGKSHTFAATGGPALILEVSLPSVAGDNFFSNARIGNGGVL